MKKTLTVTVCVLQMLLLFLMLSCVSDGAQTNKLISFTSIDDFKAHGSEPPIWYIDTERSSLAVDAANFPDQFAYVQVSFKGKPGKYQMRLSTLTEIDGESKYRISINGDEKGIAINPESETDFISYDHDFGIVNLVPDDVIVVAFSAETNGKIPENGSTAYSRGRWTRLTLQYICCN